MIENPDGTSEVLVEHRDGIATITLVSPARRNAITPAMFTALAEALEAIARSPNDRVVVITGAGESFSSGGDLSDAFAPPPGATITPETISEAALGTIRDHVNRAAIALHRLPQPSIAMVRGIAAGAGASLALTCDLVYAAEDARFSQIFIRRALSLDCGGSWLLPRLVGLHRAKELAFFGDWVDAREAERIGLVNAVFSVADLHSRVYERAARLAAQAPRALAAIKRGLDEALDLPFERALDAEAVAQSECVVAEDFLEAMRAYAERRPPHFTGR